MKLKQILLIFAAALMLCFLYSCHDADHEDPGSDVSESQNSNPSDLTDTSVFDEESGDTKAYELGQQVGDGDIYIAYDKNEKGIPRYALEKDGRIITDFDFEDVNVLESGYVVLFRGNNIAEVRDFSGERVGKTAYRIELRKQREKISVVKIIVPEHEGSKVRKARYALATGGKRILDDELGDILIDCTLLTDFDFDSFEDLDDAKCFAMKNDNVVEEAWTYNGDKFADIYRVAERLWDGRFTIVSNRLDKGRDARYAFASGGVKTKSGLMFGGVMLTGFDFDSYIILDGGYVAFKKDGEITEIRAENGSTESPLFAYEKLSGFSVGNICAVSKGSGENVRYALAKGYDRFGAGGVTFAFTLLTDFEYTTVKGLNYSDGSSANRPTRFMLLEKADGSREIRNADCKLVLSGQFSEVIPFYGMLVVKAEKGYDLYNGDGTKTGVTGFRYISSQQIEEYRIIKTTTDSGEVRYSVMDVLNDGRLLFEDYDEKAVCDKYFDAILAATAEFVRAIKNDDFDALKRIAADEELVRQYETLLGRHNAGDRAGLTDNPAFGLLNIKLNYYEFNGTVLGTVFESEPVAFVDPQSGRAEALFIVQIYDETHPGWYRETVSLVADGKGGFKVSAVGYHLFDYPDTLYYYGQEDAD